MVLVDPDLLVAAGRADGEGAVKLGLELSFGAGTRMLR